MKNWYLTAAKGTENIKKVTIFCIVLICCLGLQGCFKAPNFPLAPTISLESIKIKSGISPLSGNKVDSLILAVRFTDGDGNIGFNASVDTLAPFNRVNSDGTFNINSKNLIISLYRRDPATTVYQKLTEYAGNQYIGYSGVIPYLRAKDISGPMEGVITYGISSPALGKGKYIYATIMLKDRSLNNSNTITTPEVLIPAN